jgi:TetR/AcrR family fatty acid metabolism transcriptional regulator
VTPAPRPRKPRDPSRRRRILDVAKRHFTAFGFGGTNLDAVAAEAGCAKGALYLEFDDKTALLRAVVEESFDTIRGRYVSEVLAIESPLERLVETLRFAFRQTAAEPLFGKLLRDDPDLRVLGLTNEPANVAEARAQVAQLRGWVEDGIARGEIRDDIDRDAVPFVLGLLRFAPLHLGPMVQLNLFSGERALSAIADVFRAGLAARPAAPPKSPKSALRRGSTQTPARRKRR